MRNHKDLNVWKCAIGLAEQVYLVTNEFPRNEAFGLVSQMRRAAVSLASNIAEGAARQGEREFLRFLHMSAGSASELDTQIEISRAIGLASPEKLECLQKHVGDIARQLQGLIRHLKQRSPQE
jgi:four helix bundle protein